MKEDLEFFDEEDDIILPVTVWGEIYYIYCIITDMIKKRKFSKSEFVKLRVQFNFWKLSRSKL